MQIDVLNILQTLLLPLAVGAVVVAGLLVWRLGRKPATPRPPVPAAAPAQQSAPLQAPPTVRAHAPSDWHAAAGGQPGAPPDAQPPTHPAAMPVAAGRPLRADLLLVDDSAVVRAKLRRLFEPAGYRIDLARDGEDALLMLSQGRYGLMVTDLEMPRLDGVGLVRAAQADPACAGMPILAITGHDDLQARLGQLQAIAGIYRKPWCDDELLAHVQALVAPSQQPAETALEA